MEEHEAPTTARRLPWRDLRAALLERGWLDATHTRLTLTAGGLTVAAAGVDDPHIRLDRYDRIAGRPTGSPTCASASPTPPSPACSTGSPPTATTSCSRATPTAVSSACPGYGAIVTNCGIDRSRARGASRWGAHMWLHVSAGLGTAPTRRSASPARPRRAC